MRNFALRTTQSIGLAMGLNVTRRTPSADVRALIQKLHPVDYGVNLIRLGDKADGGYLLPDDLDDIDYCFSPGVGFSSQFEDDLANRGIRSFLADYSVDGPAIARPEFTFDKKFLGSSNRAEFWTMQDWKGKYLNGYEKDLLMKIDIEGYEYEVLFNIPDSVLSQCRILLIEFHEFHRIFDPLTFRLFSACFDKLLEHFYVVHIHPNNCTPPVRVRDLVIPKLMEFTFVNKNRVSAGKLKPRHDFPHKLDQECFPTLRPLPLPSCWYS